MQLLRIFPGPNNDFDEGSNTFQRSRCSSTSSQSQYSECNTYSRTQGVNLRQGEVNARQEVNSRQQGVNSRQRETNPRQREVNSRITARIRNKSRTRGPNSREGKPLTHASSTPNISDLSLNNEMIPDAGLVQSYLSKPGTEPVSYSQISRLVCKRDGKGGRSPLHQASKDGLLAVVKGLIHYGAPVNSRDDVGFTPAHYAARDGYIEVLEVLKEHKADLTAVGDSGDSLLHLAARNNHAGTCGWLLDNGVAIDGQGFKGRTALHCAAMWGNLEAVRLLLMRKASVQIKDFYHKTAFDLAVSQGHPKVIKMLKDVM